MGSSAARAGQDYERMLFGEFETSSKSEWIRICPSVSQRFAIFCLFSSKPPQIIITELEKLGIKVEWLR